MLSFEDYQEIGRQHREFMKELHENEKEWRRQELERQGIIVDDTNKTKDNFHGDCDSVGYLENWEATVLYIVVMLVGAIFVDRWMIWVPTTIIWLKFILRHKDK